MNRARAVRCALAAALLAMAAGRAGAQDVLARAFDLERQGRHVEAAAAFRMVLARDPLNAPALLGAERSYTALGRRDSIQALVQRALAVDPTDVTARTVELRTARATGGEAAAAEALQRWMAAAPRSEAPYKELVRLLLSMGRVEEARAAVAAGRSRLGSPDHLRPELAQVEARAGDWVRAASEWRTETVRRPEIQSVAVFNLTPAPAAVRERVLRVLTTDTAAVARRIAADLLLAWNEPARAWSILQTALPADRDQRAAVLTGFADRSRAREGAESQLVAAAALELLAAAVDPAQAARYRVESARAFADAGDPAAARRVLRALASDAAPAGAGAAAAATLVELYVREGDMAEAQRLVARTRPRLSGSEAQRLERLIARGWIAQGRLDRAEAAVAADSSLAGDEVRGWVALYRGQLVPAEQLLRGAGARPADRGAVTERVAVVVLLQALEADSMPELGGALLLAERGDTAASARALADLARRHTGSGRPELLSFAARRAESARDPDLAHTLWTEVADRYSDSAPAPAAIIALARILASRGDAAGAARRLEQLILNHPGSALVPEARRELDRVRGLVPRS